MTPSKALPESQKEGGGIAKLKKIAIVELAQAPPTFEEERKATQHELQRSILVQMKIYDHLNQWEHVPQSKRNLSWIHKAARRCVCTNILKNARSQANCCYTPFDDRTGQILGETAQRRMHPNLTAKVWGDKLVVLASYRTCGILSS